LIYDGISGLELEARLIVTGQSVDYDFIFGQRVALASYARLDFFADYKLDERWSLFARIENLNDARYEEVYNYGTAGRSAYGGVKIAW
jgi:vitamin B12 transporter